MALSPAHITYMAASGENEKNLTIRDPKTIHSESYLTGSPPLGVDRARERSAESKHTIFSPSTGDAGPEEIHIDATTGINSINFFADGLLIVGGGLEGKIRRWRVADGQEVGAAMDAGAPIVNLAVSRDGKKVVSGTRSGLVRAWDMESDEQIGEIKGHVKPIGAVDISPDATRIVTGSDDFTACIWSISSGERLLGPLKHDGKLAAAKYSSSGDYIATATCSRESIRVYRVLDGNLVSDIPVRVGSHSNQSLVWSLHSEQLLVLSKFATIHCLDAATGSIQSEWSTRRGSRAWCIARASSSTFIATSTDSAVSFWDTTTQERIGSVLDCSHAVCSMAISHNNERLVISGNDKVTIRKLRDILPESYLIDVSTIAKKCLENALILDKLLASEKVGIERANEPPAADIRAQKSSESNVNRSLPCSGDIRHIGVEILKMDGRSGICSVIFLADGVHMVSGGSEGKIRRWRLEDGREVGAAMDAGSRVLNLSASRDGKRIVSGTQKGRVTVWNVDNHGKVAEIKGHTKSVGAVDISPDATRVATGSDDSTACVWSITSGERLLNPLKHGDAVVAVKYSSNGDLIATAAWKNGKSVRVYKSQDGSLLFDASISVGSVLNQSLAWSFDSEQLFVLSKNGKIYCLDKDTGATHYEWAIHSSDKPRCIALANSATFIAATAGSSVSFWDLTAHKQIGSVFQYGSAVRAVSISPDNGHLVGGGDDKEITLLCLQDVLPQIYFANADPREPEDGWTRKEKTELGRANEPLLALIHAHEQKHQIEALYAAGNIIDAAKSLSKFVDAASVGVKLITGWISEFTKRCVAELESIGDAASEAKKYDEAIATYSTALSLPSPKSVLEKWANVMLVHGSVNDAMNAAAKFKFPKVTIQQAICDALERADRIIEAIQVTQAIRGELKKDLKMQDEGEQWALDFHRRCLEKLAKLGDAAMNSQKYKEAVERYSAVLSRNPRNVVEIFIKRSKAQAMSGLWDKALNDADEAISLDPSRHQGYERRHAALHGKKRYSEAAEAFKEMLLMIEKSPDMQIRELRDQYVDAPAVIRDTIQNAIRHMPRELIDTDTGRLLDKTQQALAFEELPIFSELVSSMTTQLDHARIQREVESYYRYVMLSHRWEKNEPLLRTVKEISVYELEVSSEHKKLQMFCSLARSLGFRWAWSDTCCIDKLNHMALQESLVAMFAWYQGSSLTIVYLLGVSSESAEPGDLRDSIWNTRAWTYQEYVASKVVQFYTEDWKPYLGLDIFNHKESPDIILEMEQATGVSMQQLVTLDPGLGRVREKLSLASTRHTTIVEDSAYSLFGIFNAAIAVIYGEGNRAVGRLLEHVLTGSGDVTVLAWTGRSGRYNSCLPVDLTVYEELPTSHVPPLIGNSEMTNLIDELRASLPDLSLAEELYDRLRELPLPSLVASRLGLSGIGFTLEKLVATSEPCSESHYRIYRATAAGLEDVEIKTHVDLSGTQNLLLIHPWIHPLLDHEFSQNVGTLDERTRALRLLAYLMRPFGALLLAPQSRVEYKRIATDSLIVVQVRKGTPLVDLIDKICIIGIR